MKNNEQLKITSIETLRGYKEGSVVELPPFAEGQNFVVKLKRPSLMALCKEGEIPNSLLGKVSQLFFTGAVAKVAGTEKESQKAMEECYDIFTIIAKASLVKPTYEQLEECGIQLTDEQLVAIFNYSQTGVKKLESFR